MDIDGKILKPLRSDTMSCIVTDWEYSFSDDNKWHCWRYTTEEFAVTLHISSDFYARFINVYSLTSDDDDILSIDIPRRVPVLDIVKNAEHVVYLLEQICGIVCQHPKRDFSAIATRIESQVGL